MGKKTVDLALITKSARYIPVTKMLTSWEIEQLADSDDLTWPASSGENHSLVTPEDLLQEMIDLDIITSEEAHDHVLNTIPGPIFIDLSN